MISRYEAFLNDIPLSSVSPSILITDIKYQSPVVGYELFNIAKRHGSRIWQRVVEQSQVTIEFAIREYSTYNRQTVCNAIVNWAKNGGVLKCNDRPGQRLACVCTEFPHIASVLKWTDTLSITFTAYQRPFWEDETPTIVTLTSTGSRVQQMAFIPGNIEEALVEVEVEADDDVTSLSFDVGEYQMELSDLTMSEGDSMILYYDDHAIQHINQGLNSLIGNRTGSTDLLARCGEQNVFRFRAYDAAHVTFKVRGLWL